MLSKTFIEENLSFLETHPQLKGYIITTKDEGKILKSYPKDNDEISALISFWGSGLETFADIFQLGEMEYIVMLSGKFNLGILASNKEYLGLLLKKEESAWETCAEILKLLE